MCLQKKAIKRCACSPPCFPNSLHFILTIRNNLARHYPVMKPHRAWLFSSEKPPPPISHTHTNDTHCYWQTQYLHGFRHTHTCTTSAHPPIHTLTTHCSVGKEPSGWMKATDDVCVTNSTCFMNSKRAKSFFTNLRIVKVVIIRVCVGVVFNPLSDWMECLYKAFLRHGLHNSE